MESPPPMNLYGEGGDKKIVVSVPTKSKTESSVSRPESVTDRKRVSEISYGKKKKKKRQKRKRRETEKHEKVKKLKLLKDASVALEIHQKEETNYFKSKNKNKKKKRFLVQMEKINQGNVPLFTDSEAYELSNMIGGQNNSLFANDNCEGMLHAAVTMETSEPSEKKKKLDTSVVIWTGHDEIAVLKGLIDYRHKTRDESNFDWNACFDFVKGLVNANVSKKQMCSKILELKRFYQDSVERIRKGLNPLFTKDTDSQVLGYSSMLWDQNEAEVANTGLENPLHTENGMNQEETCKDSEQVVNAELENQNDVEKSKFDGNSFHEETTEYKTDDEENIGSQFAVNVVNMQNENSEDKQVANVEPLNGNVAEKRDFDDKIKEKETTGKESNGNNDVVDDELFAVKDAFEMMMPIGLSGYQKKLQLEKLMNIGTRKRKEFSSEWKEICYEEAKLTLKTLRLSTKLVEGATQG